ncbi:MAG TPA: glycine betaine ABC transporter substrate-binding protein, partial [Nitrospiraceae bacterium]|nr:glycine betaine ABC transporter substrate-binding protein [Nitrospiraceae bacterium]
MMTGWWRLSLHVASGFAFAVVLLGCDAERTVAIGSKNFTEQMILGELLAQHIEARTDLRVKRQFNL